MKKNFLVIGTVVTLSCPQSNTATANGSIGKCGVWSYPYTLYKNSGATQTVNDGVTVTVNKNRNIVAVNLSGSGAMEMSGTTGITFSGSGTEITCRWDIPMSKRDYIDEAPNGGTVYRLIQTSFSAPFPGNFICARAGGWGAAHSGPYSAGRLSLVTLSGINALIYSRSEAGSCAVYTGWTIGPATWIDSLPVTLNAGEELYYTAIVPSNNSCHGIRMDYNIGNAFLLYNN